MDENNPAHVFAIVKFESGFELAQKYPLINRENEYFLIFQTLDDGTQLAVRLDKARIDGSQIVDPWGQHLYDVGQVSVTSQVAVTLAP